MVSTIIDGGTGLTLESSRLVSVIVVVVLILLLIARELGSAEASTGRRKARLRFLVKASNGPILALLGVFVIILAAQVLAVL